MNESPAKLGLIGIGVIGVLGGVIWEAFRSPDAPTAMGSNGQSDWLAIVMQVGGVVSMLMAAFSDVKKVIPADAINAIKKMIKERSVDVGELIAIYGKIDMAAVLELIKKIKGGFMPPIKIDGDVITIDPAAPIVDPKPVDPAKLTDAGRLRRLLMGATEFDGGPAKVSFSVGNASATLEVRASTESNL